MEKLLSDKKIAVLGAGAVGSFYGGMLAKSGFDVTLISRGEHLKAIQSKGLTVLSYKFGEFNLKIKADDKLDDTFDIIIVSTKSEDTFEACKDINKHLNAEGFVISFQNGVDNIWTIARFVPPAQVIPSKIYVGLSIKSPGIISHTAEGIVCFGASEETNRCYVEKFREIISKTPIDFRVEKNIVKAQWEKLLWNLAFNPLSALTESTCGRLSADKDLNMLIKKIVEEGKKAAFYRGINISEDYINKIPGMVKGLENFKTSMLQDIQKGKNPEIDGIILPIIKTMAENGDSAPYCETIYRILKFKYGGKFVYTPKLTVDMIVENPEGKILLIKRKNQPFGWALPGGFVDYGEKVENAAVRELQEETGIEVDISKINLLGVYSDPSRDSRGHTTSVVYWVKSDKTAEAADDASDAAFYKISALPGQIAFDHREILEDYINRTF